MPAPYAVSSDLVSAWPAKSLDVAQYIDNYVPLLAMPQNAQTGTTYTLAATDTTKLVTLSNGSPVAVTVPLESTVAWATGTQLRLLNLGGGLVTIAGAVGVTITGTPLTLATSRAATLVKTGTNQWVIVPYGIEPGLAQVAPTTVTNGTLTGATVTFSAVSSVNLNGCFTSAYDNYRIIMQLSSATSPTLTQRLRAAGTDISAANYNQQRVDGSGTSLSASRTTGASAWLTIGLTTPSCTFVQDMLSPALTAVTTAMTNINRDPGSTDVALANLAYNASTAADGFSLICATGNMSGTIRIYGYRN